MHACVHVQLPDVTLLAVFDHLNLGAGGLRQHHSSVM